MEILALVVEKNFKVPVTLLVNGIDATILRLLVVLFTLAGGSGVLFYIVAALIMPDEPEYY